MNAVFSGSGDIQLGKLREAIQECYEQAGFDMKSPAPADKEPPTLEMLEAVLAQWSEKGGQIKSLQVRLQPLFMSGIFDQGKADSASMTCSSVPPSSCSRPASRI
ncbi:MAG: hypothetical protein EA400_15125 [Chromatiaceae bacterium]|nr:MAG: hypothetical protein EA400_15125 [Chromatiaceae bacterium]